VKKIIIAINVIEKRKRQSRIDNPDTCNIITIPKAKHVSKHNTIPMV
jgi:hypothetical protein